MPSNIIFALPYNFLHLVKLCTLLIYLNALNALGRRKMYRDDIVIISSAK